MENDNHKYGKQNKDGKNGESKTDEKHDSGLSSKNEENREKHESNAEESGLSSEDDSSSRSLEDEKDNDNKDASSKDTLTTEESDGESAVDLGNHIKVIPVVKLDALETEDDESNSPASPDSVNDSGIKSEDSNI